MKTLLSAKNEQRQASWLELFFDLIFVSVFNLLTDNLANIKHGIITIEEIWNFIFSFTPLWWIWATHTLFANRFAQNNYFYKIHTLLIMSFLILLVSSSSQCIETRFKFFVSIYCVIRLLLAVGYFVIYKTRNNYKNFTYQKSVFILMGVVISVVALFFKNEKIRMIIFFLGIISEMILHIIVSNNNIIFSVNRKHLVERVGILTVIILGQTVFSILVGLSSYKTLTKDAIIAVWASFVFIATLWTVYFSNIYLLTKAHCIKHGIVFIYSHLLFYIGLIILACLVRHVIIQDISRESFLLYSMIGMPLFYVGRQIAYIMAYPVKKITFALIISSLVSIFITFLSAYLFENTAYALSGMAFAMLVYLILVMKWVLRYKSLLFKYMD